MGMDLTVFMVDWGQLGTVPVEHRIGRLEDLAWPGELSDVYDGGAERAHGWLWPPGQAPAWCAVYRFLTTTGAHMPHVRAGAAWADMRPLVGPPVREVMDSFLEGLIWDGDQADAPDTFEGFVALLREWGAVVTEAARRGWGLVGLP
ncbi:hypothetical protein ACZ90_15335 [Streptomyces albus subsp. albus]|nr:hypothetical protein ACZ90_15335 [Streptomyces albus subsp. albus]